MKKRYTDEQIIGFLKAAQARGAGDRAMPYARL